MTEGKLAAEYLALLARAGITIPPARMADAVKEFAELRTHIERVNASCPPEGEPSPLFDPLR